MVLLPDAAGPSMAIVDGLTLGSAAAWPLPATRPSSCRPKAGALATATRRIPSSFAIAPHGPTSDRESHIVHDPWPALRAHA